MMRHRDTTHGGLAESFTASPVPADFARQFANTLRTGNTSNINDYLDWLITYAGYRYGTDPDVDRLFVDNQRKILATVDQQLEQHGLGHALHLLDTLQKMDLPWDSLDSWLDDHEPEIMRRLLTNLKKGWYDRVEDELGWLREAGVHWPDLAIIQNSNDIGADEEQKRVDESDDSGYSISKGDLVDGMRAALRRGSNGAWGNSYAHMLPWSPEMRRERLEPIKADIIAWIDHWLRQPGSTVGKQAVYDLWNIEADWPELSKVIDDNRGAWIRKWLGDIKKYIRHPEELDHIRNDIRVFKRHLAKHGMEWSEIQTILDSLDRHLGIDERQILSEGPDLRRYVKRDGGTMFVRIPVDEVWHTDGRGYWTGVVKPVKVIDIKQDMEPTGDLSGWIGDLAVYFDTDTWDTDRDGLIYTDPQFLKDLKNLFLRMGIPREIVDDIRYSEQGMQGDHWVSFDANAFADYVADQFIIGDAATIKQRKPEIMRQLLTMIKQGGTVRVTALIKKLRELGADWSDLDVIERSLSHEIKRRTRSDEARKTDPQRDSMAEVWRFLKGLAPDDVGVEDIGPYRVHFEGFTDDCIWSAEQRCALAPGHPARLERYDDVYDEVQRDFKSREHGAEPIHSGLTGSDENPIAYAVFARDKRVSESSRRNPQDRMDRYADTLYDDLQNPNNHDMLAMDLEDMGLLEIEWQPGKNLLDMIIKHKPEIIRSLLSDIRTRRYPENLLSAVDALENMGIRWSELDTIRHSLELHDRRRRSQDLLEASEQEQLAAIAAAEDWQVPDLMKTPLMRKTNTTVQLAAFNKRPVALRWTRNPTTETQYQAFLRIPGTAAYWITRVDPQIWADEDVKAAVLDSLTRALQTSPVHRREAGQYIKRLQQVGCPWPELDAIYLGLRAEKMPAEIRDPGPETWTDPVVKTKTMRNMLTLIKKGKLDKAGEILKHLRDHGCPWPELDIIARSVAADQARRAGPRRQP